MKTVSKSEMVKPPSRRYLALASLLIVALDQVTKILAVEKLEGREPVELFWTLQLNTTRNKGASFSLGTEYTSLLAVVALVAAIGIVYFSRTARSPLELSLFGVVLGGVLGNVGDRIFRSSNGFLNGGVVDFIDFQWWPIFNVADMALVVGLPSLVILMLRDGRESE